MGTCFGEGSIRRTAGSQVPASSVPHRQDRATRRYARSRCQYRSLRSRSRRDHNRRAASIAAARRSIPRLAASGRTPAKPSTRLLAPRVRPTKYADSGVASTPRVAAPHSGRSTGRPSGASFVEREVGECASGDNTRSSGSGCGAGGVRRGRGHDSDTPAGSNRCARGYTRIQGALKNLGHAWREVRSPKC